MTCEIAIWSPATSLCAIMQARYPRRHFQAISSGGGVEKTAAEFEELAARSPLLTGVVIAPGSPPSKAALEIAPAAWGADMDTFLMRPLYLCQAAGRQLSVRGGSIVMVVSDSALSGVAGRSTEATVGAALVSYARAAAIEWGRRGVRVNIVAGLSGAGKLSPAEAAAATDRSPLRMSQDQAEICGAIAYLLSEEAALVTGAVHLVDSGLGAGFLTRWHGADYASNALLERGIYEESMPDGVRQEKRS